MKKTYRTEPVTNAQLRDLIHAFKLTRPQVRVATCSEHTATVDRWLVPPKKRGKPNPTYRTMPLSKLELLKFKLSSMDKTLS